MHEHPERIVPDETPLGIIEHHLAKYRFAMGRGLPAPVLDAACGVGYASAFLAEHGQAGVVGLDISPEAMAVAVDTYASSGAAFVRADVVHLPFATACFGSAVGFETVEHVPDAAGYLAEVRRVLRPGGTFVCSTPYVARTDRSPANPYHLVELDPDDFLALLRPHFAEVELFSQLARRTTRASILRRLDVLGVRRRLSVDTLARAGRLAGSAATPLRTEDDYVVTAGVDRRATEILAVCTT